MDKAKIKDYITTFALAVVPVLIAYQSQIGQYVPVEYALAFTIIMGILSQVVTNDRVRIAFEDTSSAVDAGQDKVAELQATVASLQAQIDAGQEKVEDVMQ